MRIEAARASRNTLYRETPPSDGVACFVSVHGLPAHSRGRARRHNWVGRASGASRLTKAESWMREVVT